MLTLDRVAGALVLLKAVDVALRGPGDLGPVGWLLALAAFLAAGAALLRGPRSLKASRVVWSCAAVATAAVAVDAPLELRRQHLFLLGATALALAVARDERERLLLVRWQLTALYGVAALAKLNESFLGGSVLALALRDGPVGGVPPAAVLTALAVLVVAVEVALAGTPWVRRLRVAGTALAAVLHASALALLSSDAGVGLRLVVFGGLAVLLHAASAGLVAAAPQPRQSRRRTPISTTSS